MVVGWDDLLGLLAVQSVSLIADFLDLLKADLVLLDEIFEVLVSFIIFACLFMNKKLKLLNSSQVIFLIFFLSLNVLLFNKYFRVVD